jgi:PilZ domain
MKPERRAHVRQRVDRRGLVSFNNGRSTLPCRLVDYSAGGALLAADFSAELPDAVTLYFDAIASPGLGAVAARCEVVRRSPTNFAVRFLFAA